MKCLRFKILIKCKRVCQNILLLLLFSILILNSHEDAKGAENTKFPWAMFLPAIIETVEEEPASYPSCITIAGEWSGLWSETSCDGHRYSGSWTGRVTEDCRFNGTDNWDFVNGTINPSSMILTASGISQDGCGAISLKGTFTKDGSVSGNYTYSFSGGGSFTGERR